MVHKTDRHAQSTPNKPAVDSRAVDLDPAAFFKGKSPSRSLRGAALGLDRLSLSFPVGRFDAGMFERQSVAVDPLSGEVRSEKYATQIGPVSRQVMVGVAMIDGKPWGKVEANPSRFADPDGCSLADVETFAAAVEVMWYAAALVTQPACDQFEARVKRVDVARDFRGVAAPEFYVRGLQNVRRPYAKRVGVWSDAKAGNAQTLHVGSGAGMVRLYDQNAAYAAKGAPEGSLRWELEARGGSDGWLSKVGISRVRDVTVAALRSIAEERWEWSSMGEVVTGTANVVEVVAGAVRCGQMSQSKADRLLGQLVRESLGVSGSVSKTTAAEYERWKRRLAVRPSAELFAGADVEVRGRLDWQTGTEIAA